MIGTGPCEPPSTSFPSSQIQERLEELQSMLGWVLVRWRAQRHQRDPGNKQEDRKDPESPLRVSPAGQVSTQCTESSG